MALPRRCWVKISVLSRLFFRRVNARWFHPPSRSVTSCLRAEKAASISARRCSVASVFPHMFSDSGRFMHVIQTASSAGLFAVKNGFHLSVRR
ncbi:hypothetical protein KCP74_04410 [Salmonella enterica subsp. enterica]|nr:hypothetical protein KCP74_04410 [Salmonella enterica subsp. enterica]